MKLGFHPIARKNPASVMPEPLPPPAYPGDDGKPCSAPVSRRGKDATPTPPPQRVADSLKARAGPDTLSRAPFAAIAPATLAFGPPRIRASAPSRALPPHHSPWPRPPPVPKAPPKPAPLSGPLRGPLNPKP